MDGKKTSKELISELKKLREENRDLRNIVENSKDMIYRMILPEGLYDYVSSASYDVMGYKPEEFYNSPLIISKIIHPDWKEYFEKQWSFLLEGEMPPFYEYQIIHKSGETRWIYQKNVLLKDDEGTPVAIEGIVSDITERVNAENALKISEARLKEAQKMAKIGNWHWDVKTGEVEWSDEVFNIFRLNSDEFKPQIDSILSLSPWPEESKRGEELIKKAIESKKKGSYEQRFLFPDGSIGYYFSTFQGIYDDNGNLTSLKGTVQDITERKNTENEKSKLEEQYRQAQKVESIGRLAGGVAHDLNNLLTPILGYGEMLADEFTEDDRRSELVSEIMSAGMRARNLIRQLLAFSRKQALEYKILNIFDIIEGIEKLLRRTIRENINIEIIPPKTPQNIKADIGQIEQVILNLAINAQDAMAEGGTLTIESKLVNLDKFYVEDHYDTEIGKYVMLAISDTGIGMDASVREQIFEPFFSTKGKMGTGLGLATVYGIVKQHGGNISVYSEKGKGSTFKIYLPHYNEKTEEKKKPDRSVTDLKGSETILIAEDNENVRRLTGAVLKKCGYRVLEAENGKEALKIIKSWYTPVDLLLTDVIMPGLNGKELYNKASEIYPELKVIYFSGYTDNVIAHHGILDDGIDFIQKPFSSEVLASKIREVLDKK